MNKIRNGAAKAATGAAAITMLVGSVAGAAAAQGSGGKGDIDLAVPAGATIAVGGSSFSAPLYAYFTVPTSPRLQLPSAPTLPLAQETDGRRLQVASTTLVSPTNQWTQLPEPCPVVLPPAR